MTEHDYCPLSLRQRYLSGVCSLDIIDGLSQDILFRSLLLKTQTAHLLSFIDTVHCAGFYEADWEWCKCLHRSLSSTSPMPTSVSTSSSRRMTRNSGRSINTSSHDCPRNSFGISNFVICLPLSY